MTSIFEETSNATRGITPQQRRLLGSPETLTPVIDRNRLIHDESLDDEDETDQFFEFLDTETQSEAVFDDPKSTEQEDQFQSFLNEIEGIEETDFTKQQESELQQSSATARTAFNVFKTIAGLPGDIREGLGGFLADFVDDAFGESPRFRAAMLGGPEAQDIMGFPTSEQIQEGAEFITTQAGVPELLESPSVTTQFMDEVVKDITSLSLPVKGKVPFSRAIGTSFAANVLPESLKALGFSKNAQSLSKLGTMLMSGFVNRQSVERFSNNKIRSAKKLIPDGTKVKASKIENLANNLLNDLREGSKNIPDKNLIISELEDLLGKISNGEVDLKELMALRFDLGKLAKFEAKDRGVRKLFGAVQKEVDKAIDTYSSQNPQAIKSFRDGIEARAATEQSGKIWNFVQNKLDVSKWKPETMVLFGFLGGPKGIASAAAASGGINAIRIFKEVSKSPVLRKFYFEGLKRIMREDAAGATRAINNLDRELSKKLDEE